jgi:hypothetical protein
MKIDFNYRHHPWQLYIAFMNENFSKKFFDLALRKPLKGKIEFNPRSFGWGDTAGTCLLQFLPK